MHERVVAGVALDDEPHVGQDREQRTDGGAGAPRALDALRPAAPA